MISGHCSEAPGGPESLRFAVDAASTVKGSPSHEVVNVARILEGYQPGRELKGMKNRLSQATILEKSDLTIPMRSAIGKVRSGHPAIARVRPVTLHAAIGWPSKMLGDCDVAGSLAILGPIGS
eukprot:10769618-Lingulodinium_polyedra.AAC.1